MDIGSVAEASGVPATTIHYYESVGLRHDKWRASAEVKELAARHVVRIEEKVRKNAAPAPDWYRQPPRRGLAS